MNAPTVFIVEDDPDTRENDLLTRVAQFCAV